MIIDTHAHLTDPKLQELSIETIIKNAELNDVKKIITVGTGVGDSLKAAALADKFPNIYSAVGLYPNDTHEEQAVNDKEKLKIIRTIKSGKIVAVGECGLDYSNPPPWEIKRTREKQIELFEAQIELAKDLDLPVILHSREALADTLDILKNARKRGGVNVVWHCFTEDLSTLKKLLDIGVLVSFTGIATYPSADNVRDLIRYVPLDHFMIETDSPLLVPQPARKKNIKINEPAYAKMIIEEISAVRNRDFVEICELTTRNAEKFFNL